ncbi:zinc metalloproteinase nas-14-like isoform X2 [Zootermopsis nevadensis]|uniref:Metalloendopeptidase n=2 Tax=Zootermopsis nevadensis TaxID=136037 RepID=A0A067RMU6_ZOONE|nr:zinc metalloproteinase nas-14-like isoform X2 [Zootermopsis nevadensis]XP_021914778.1 zinc metalloproteinase nas-14-like isoform X2 [Zootermopsis nevadensis]XP_021914779.1 zinc metalloproteinase nas-14-like isoform X2 [Zootermopsis nevadensis]XP_021914780.1 zinc metalloproteinase nas-14-like isoform X2 [Zootermopsis nevadensis]KDR21945.1 Zinc metalloproteinase nas-14 [Zootermopsis nevadensis]
MPEGRNALLVKEYLWPSGVVPYVFHSNFTEDEKAKVKAGMKGIQEKTCVKFVPHTSEADYIEFRKDPQLGCGAMVGRRPGRGFPMAVNYQAPECLQTTGTIQHELLHVLGLFHEQARPDRDNYVTVLWDNIIPEFKNNFVKAPDDVATTYNVPYDYKSLMHYHNTAYSKNGKNTIVAKNDTSLILGQVEGPTEGDIKKIRKLYNCINAQESTLILPWVFKWLSSKKNVKL